jgi:hypothetical protein
VGGEKGQYLVSMLLLEDKLHARLRLAYYMQYRAFPGGACKRELASARQHRLAEHPVGQDRIGKRVFNPPLAV